MTSPEQAAAIAITARATRAMRRVALPHMSLMHHRRYLRALTAAQRRHWFEQRKRLAPRVRIGSAWLPEHVRRWLARR